MKPKLVIAGPGAGKTYGMVQSIIQKVSSLSSARYMIVITYTNSAADNIKHRLSQHMTIPPNVFIGTIHAFLNKFIVIPYASINNVNIKKDKIFIQCQTDDIFERHKKDRGLSLTNNSASALKKRIRESLNKKGYISFDQTISLAKDCIDNVQLKKIVSNRIQFLYIDEFQDTNNQIFHIVDTIRKEKKTEIYCVGDPEQFIQSFDNSVKTFANLPFFKMASNSKYELEFNKSNYRSTGKIVEFLNHFNSRSYGDNIFSQENTTGILGESVKFITKHDTITSIIPIFNELCDKKEITNHDRCIIGKRNELIKRIANALSHNVKSPGKNNSNSPIKSIIDTLLFSLRMNQTEFCEKYKTDVYTLRKHAIAILKALKHGTITNEDTYGNFLLEELNLEMKAGVPIKIENIKIYYSTDIQNLAVTVSNIHSIKGLEAEAVLVIAKTEEELLLWIEKDRTIRETYRNKESTDYPRLGYVAFSRAKKLLCIACLQQVSTGTLAKLIALDVELLGTNPTNVGESSLN
jgi:DNA helicase-2/ATP-dependent DNA helicase PcrA